MPRKPSLRVVADDERRAEPMSLLDAVESGDVLAMLLAQRRLMAEKLVTAAENTRPQFNNELNKLHALIAAEELKRANSAMEDAQDAELSGDVEFNASAL